VKNAAGDGGEYESTSYDLSVKNHMINCALLLRIRSGVTAENYRYTTRNIKHY